mgnify:CR=1 FL=1
MSVGEENNISLSASLTIYLIISILIAIIIRVIYYTYVLWNGWPLLLDDKPFDASDDWPTTVEKIARLQNSIFWILLIIIFFVTLYVFNENIGSWDPLFSLLDTDLGKNLFGVFILVVQLAWSLWRIIIEPITKCSIHFNINCDDTS